MFFFFRLKNEVYVYLNSCYVESNEYISGTDTEVYVDTTRNWLISL